MNDAHRWNIEPLPDGRLRICRGLHDKQDGCHLHWEYFVPERPADQPAVAREWYRCDEPGCGEMHLRHASKPADTP